MKSGTVSRHVQYAMTLLLLFVTLISHAERPRVGLVLGGGGARGGAHIGVLKELERHQVPVDVIAGTSMGAIIGGLYASGMSIVEIEETVAALDWADAMSDTPPREDLSFRRKQDDARYPINLELGLRDAELLLPMGMIQGQKLELILRELTIDVSDVSNFDELPIPFRAIATDIETGDAHVMGQGDLAQAIRASMSVPAIFAPKRLDGRLLVDGGIAANLPVEVMRGMGVDIIIAVDVEFPLYAADELVSAVTISEQMLTILMRRETLRQIDLLSDKDILIRPALGMFDSGDFAKILETIEPGESAARAVADQLRQLSLGEQQFREHLTQRAKPRPVDDKLAFVRVVHDERLAPGIFESRLDVEAGDQIDTSRLAREAELLYGLNLFEQVSYNLVTENGATGVEFQARTKSWGPNLLQFAVSLENDFEGSTAFNVGTRVTRTRINSSDAEWQTDLQLGTDPLLVSEFYQPFGSGSRYFVAPRIDLRQTNLQAFVAEDAVARYRISESEFAYDLGAQIGVFGEFRFGGYHGTGRARVKVGDPSLPNYEFDTGGVLTRLRFDTLDNAQFPRSGMRADLNWNSSLPGMGADERFDTVDVEFQNTWSHGKNSWQVGARYATTLDSQGAIQDLFLLGGFLHLSGIERGAISGPHAALARLLYYRRVGQSSGGLFDVPIYLGVSAEVGNVWRSRSDISFDTALVNGSMFAGFDTIIGPVYLAAGFGEGGRRNYHLFFGAPPR
jgi:NTE family protein